MYGGGSCAYTGRRLNISKKPSRAQKLCFGKTPHFLPFSSDPPPSRSPTTNEAFSSQLTPNCTIMSIPTRHTSRTALTACPARTPVRNECYDQHHHDDPPGDEQGIRTNRSRIRLSNSGRGTASSFMPHEFFLSQPQQPLEYDSDDGTQPNTNEPTFEAESLGPEASQWGQSIAREELYKIQG